MNNPDIRKQIEDIITSGTTASHLYEAEHRDLCDAPSIAFDMVPMFKDLEILVRNLECLQKKEDGKSDSESGRRITSCSYATLRIIATLKTMFARSTSESFAREVLRTAMGKHFGTVSHMQLSYAPPTTTCRIS